MAPFFGDASVRAARRQQVKRDKALRVEVRWPCTRVNTTDYFFSCIDAIYVESAFPFGFVSSVGRVHILSSFSFFSAV